MSRGLGRIERAILASIAASKRMAINRTEKYREVIEAAIAAGGVQRFERVYTPQEGTARKRWTVKSGTVGRRYRCASRLVSTHGAARREFDAALGTTNAQPELRQGLEWWCHAKDQVAGRICSQSSRDSAGVRGL